MSIDIEKIVKYLKDNKEILAAYIYGSFAKKRPTNLSDIDIAILSVFKKDPVAKFEERMQSAAQLSKICGREVDLVLLEDCGDLLRYEIIKTGKLIYEADREKHRDFVARAIINYLDFSYLEKIMQSGMIKAIREGR